MEKRVIRKLIEVEKRLGFLYISASGVELMPDKSSEITVVIDSHPHKLKYNSIYKRIFGLTKWYKKHSVMVGSEVVIERLEDNKYSFSFKEQPLEASAKEAEKLIDISGLSSQAKGNIVEDRVKELIVLQGQGLLSVYKPVTDTQGIDLIVTKAGQFHPIFLQVKSRFNVEKQGTFIMRINKRTFTPHNSYFVIGAYFNPKTLEIDKNILFIPSHEVAKASMVKTKLGDRYNITTILNDNAQSRWAKFLIKKSELANRVMYKFEEIDRILR